MAERVVAVVDTFDEAGQQPANYVVQVADGMFEARVWDMMLEKELTLGICSTCNEAAHMVCDWSNQVRWLADCILTRGNICDRIESCSLASMTSWPAQFEVFMFEDQKACGWFRRDYP